MTRTDSRTKRLKTLAAFLGASAVITMGLISAAAGGADNSQTAVVSDGTMSTGETTTVTYSGTIAPVVAAPVVKAAPYGAG